MRAVAAARRRQELAKTAPSQSLRNSSPRSPSRNCSRSLAWATPSSLNGESRKSESKQKNNDTSLAKAQKKRMGQAKLRGLLKHSFQALSPWRTKMTRFVLETGEADRPGSGGSWK